MLFIVRLYKTLQEYDHPILKYKNDEAVKIYERLGMSLFSFSFIVIGSSPAILTTDYLVLNYSKMLISVPLLPS